MIKKDQIQKQIQIIKQSILYPYFDMGYQNWFIKRKLSVKIEIKVVNFETIFNTLKQIIDKLWNVLISIVIVGKK